MRTETVSRDRGDSVGKVTCRVSPAIPTQVVDTAMPRDVPPTRSKSAPIRWQLQLKTMFLLTAGIALMCWLAINFSWLKSQVSVVQTSGIVLETKPPGQAGGIVVLTPRQVNAQRLHPMLPGHLRWLAIWLVVAVAGALWWRLWRQNRLTVIAPPEGDDRSFGKPH